MLYRCDKITTHGLGNGPTAQLSNNTGELLLTGDPVWEMEEGQFYEITIQETKGENMAAAHVKAAFDQLAEHPDIQGIDPAKLQSLIALILQFVTLFLHPMPTPPAPK